MRSMILASCRDNAVWVSITWDDTVAYEQWLISSYTVENRLSYAVGFELRVAGMEPITGDIAPNTTPPITSTIPKVRRTHPDNVDVSFKGC